MHCRRQLESSVRHCTAPNGVPFSCRRPILPHPPFHSHPRPLGPALPAPVTNGEQGPGPMHTWISAPGFWSPQSSVLSPAFPAKMGPPCPGAMCFQALLQRCASKTHPHFSTSASIPLVQGVSPWAHHHLWALLSQICWKPLAVQSFPRMLCALRSLLQWPQ